MLYLSLPLFLVFLFHWYLSFCLFNIIEHCKYLRWNIYLLILILNHSPSGQCWQYPRGPWTHLSIFSEIQGQYLDILCRITWRHEVLASPISTSSCLLYFIYIPRAWQVSLEQFKAIAHRPPNMNVAYPTQQVAYAYPGQQWYGSHPPQYGVWLSWMINPVLINSLPQSSNRGSQVRWPTSMPTPLVTTAEDTTALM